MASLEEIQAEIQRRSGGIQGSVAAPAAAPASGISNADITAELERRSQPAPQEAEPNYAGLAARTAIKGATGAVFGLPALLQSGVTGPINAMYMGQNYLANKANETFGTNIPQAKLIPSALNAVTEGGEYLANAAGAPQPQTPKQKLAVEVGSAGLSALGPGGFGRLLTRAAPAGGVLSEAGQAMSATPLLDVMSGATGEAAAKAVEGKGGTTGQQIGAGFGASLAPYALAVAGRRAVSPFPSQLSPEQQRLAGVLQEAGVPLSAGQATGNKNLQFIENQTAKLPFGDLISASPTEGQRPAFVRAALKEAGVNAEAATPEVLSEAHNKIGSTIGDIAKEHTVQFDPQYTKDIYGVVSEYGKNLKPDQRQIVDAYLSDLKKTSNLSGEDYQKIRSQMGRRIRAENGVSGDKELQGALIGIQSALDDAAERSMIRAGKPSDASSIGQARQQYANLLTIEDAVARSGEAGAKGEIQGSALAAAAKAALGKRQYVRGAGDLNDLARAGDAFLRPLPDSGTAQRMAWPAYGTLIAGGLHYGGPFGAVAAAAAPTAAGVAINSPLAQAYFRNQLLAGKQRLPIGQIPGLLEQ
jgi:hypothetical protein